MTKVEVYTAIKELVDKAEIAEDVKAEIKARMDKDIELASKKGSISKPKVNADMDALVVEIKSILTEATKPMTIPEIMSALTDYTCKDGKALTSQRVSSVLTYMGKGTKQKEGLGIVVRTEEKKVAYFSLIAEDEESED